LYTFHLFSAAVSGIMTVKIDTYEKDGVQRVKLDKITFDGHVEKAKIQMNNLFNGNKELGKLLSLYSV